MKTNIIFAITAVTLLSGCASNWDVDAAADQKPVGDAFTQALHKNYVDRAQFEVTQQDWVSVKAFNDRALMAAEGKTVELRPLPEGNALGAAKSEIEASHAKLTTALAGSAPKDAPDACARAQTWLEHWMEQQKEGHQADHIAMTRNGFMTAMPDCKPTTVAAAPVEPVAAAPMAPFTIYFNTDSTDITAAGRKVLSDAVVTYNSGAPANVIVVGHTDTVGSNAYNDNLADKRAEKVADELNAMGVKASVLRVSSHGQDRMAVQTGDNVQEPRNRRVEIRFVK